MSATVTVSSRVELTGLGKDVYMQDVATDGTVPTASTYNYRVLAAAGTAEALDLGDVSTVTVLMIRAIDKDLDVDLDFVDEAFDKDFTLKAGKPAAVIPNPAGIIYVKNNVIGETPAYEFFVNGTT